MNINEALEAISVMEAADIPNCPDALKGWWAVTSLYGVEDVVIAYFPSEQTALRFRLDKINRMLNG